MSEKHDLLILPNQGDSSIVLSETRSSLAARGRKDATRLVALRKALICLAAVQTRSGAGEGNWGFIDRSGIFAIPPVFQWATGHFREGYTQVKFEGENRFIDAQGSLLGPPGLDACSDFRSGFAWVRRGDRFGLLDSQGSLRFLRKFHQVREEWGQCEGRYAVRVGSKWGFIDGNGDMVIHPLFDGVGHFSEGCVDVFRDHKSLLIDRNGTPVGPSDFDAIGPLSCGLAPFRRGDKRGYIDRNGTTVIRPQFDRVGEFYKGLAFAELKGRRGVIDIGGTFVVPPQFDDVKSFAAGMTVVKVDCSWGLFESPGRVIVEPRYRFIGNLSEGLALVVEDHPSSFSGVKGFINGHGEVVIQPQFGDAADFHNGLARACLNERGDQAYGYIDMSGGFVVPPIFSDEIYASDFKEGLAMVCDGKSWGFIDTTGEAVIPMQFESANDFHLVEEENNELCFAPNYSWL
jgi:hypothetical protein